MWIELLVINKHNGMLLPKFVSVHYSGIIHLKCLVNIKVCPEVSKLTTRTKNGKCYSSTTRCHSTAVF